MKNELLNHLQGILQNEADRVCQLYELAFELRIGTIRSEDGYFKADVTARKNTEASRLPPAELVRSLAATVEQNVEEKYQGLRLMLLPSQRKQARKPRQAS